MSNLRGPSVLFKTRENTSFIPERPNRRRIHRSSIGCDRIKRRDVWSVIIWYTSRSWWVTREDTAEETRQDGGYNEQNKGERSYRKGGREWNEREEEGISLCKSFDKKIIFVFDKNVETESHLSESKCRVGMSNDQHITTRWTNWKDSEQIE